MYFASFGANNTYGHPSYEVIANIEVENYFIGVTEDRNSALVDTVIHNYV
jgi:beta-lactamase superfamily II metal-dependent hydrolase